MKHGGGGEHGGPRAESCAAVFLRLSTRRSTNVDVLPVGRFQRWKLFFLRQLSLRRQVRRGRFCCNAVKSDFFGGTKRRAGGFSPLTIPTLCRGSAAESGERARSCRCLRAGRKPGITMAECFSSTTTPGKLRGLTPEIGMLKA